MEKADPNKCQLVLTVAAKNKTVTDDLQARRISRILFNIILIRENQKQQSR